MTAQEIIEKIRAEVKIRLSANGAFDEEGDSAWHYDQGLNDAYNYILSFLDTLEKEEKPIEGLEEEIRRYQKEVWDYDTLLSDVARHFAQWQKEQMMDEWLKDRDGCFWDGVEEGKKAMREQMMKEAVEGEVVTTNKYTSVRYLSRYGTFRYFYGIGCGFQKGDKVKLIIVKED